MACLSKVSEQLSRYISARIPFVSIKTTEPGRVLNILKEISIEKQLPFHTHSSTRGVYLLNNGKCLSQDKSIYSALEVFNEQLTRRDYYTAILSECFDLSAENDDTRQLLSLVNLANESGGMIIVLTNGEVWNQLQRAGMSLELDPPNEDEMFEIIHAFIHANSDSAQVEWTITDEREAASILAGFTQIEAENIIASFLVRGKLCLDDLDEIRQTKDSMFNDISGLEKITVDPSDKDVGGLDGLRKWLNEKKVLFSPEKRDMLRDKGLRPPRGILLVGVAGCGKSLSAKSIAANWKLPLYRLDFATVQGMYVGQSENQLREALNTAEQVSPCVLWIDEIEKGLSGVRDVGNSTSTRMVGQFLFWLQENRKQVFVVATANDVSQLPPELLRRGRFDEIFFVDLPTKTERRSILELYFGKYLNVLFQGPFSDKVVELTEGFTGADLESTVRDLAYRKMANENFRITEENVINSFENVIPLSRTSPEVIESIRAWGKERAVPASGKPIGENPLKGSNGPRIRKILV